MLGHRSRVQRPQHVLVERFDAFFQAMLNTIQPADRTDAAGSSPAHFQIAPDCRLCVRTSERSAYARRRILCDARTTLSRVMSTECGRVAKGKADSLLTQLLF